MHDIDRTQREAEMEAHEHGHELHEQEAEHEGQSAHEHEHEHEAFLGSLFAEAEQEGQHEHEHEAESGEAEHEQEAESPLSESQEMELASELLEVSNEAELEYFLGRLARAAVRGAKGFARSSAGRALGGMLKTFAKKALPIAGTAVGGFFGGPLGAKIGGGLGRVATNLFELELEGLSHEDREFEVARQVVRLGAASMNRAAQLRRLAPHLAARRAFTSAARVYAPGLLRRPHHHCRACAARNGLRRRAATAGRQYTSGGGYVAPAPSFDGASSVAFEPASAAGAYSPGSRSGRWIRRGRNVVLLGI